MFIPPSLSTFPGHREGPNVKWKVKTLLNGLEMFVSTKTLNALGRMKCKRHSQNWRFLFTQNGY